MARRGAIPTPPLPKAPKPLDPNKAVLAPPRIKAISTRDYGKGGTPAAGSPDRGIRGAGIGYGGFEEGGSVPKVIGPGRLIKIVQPLTPLPRLRSSEETPRPLPIKPED